MANKPVHLITCKACGWQPDETVKSVNEIREHKHDDGSPSWIGLMAFCPKYHHLLVVRRSVKTAMGKTRTIYDCNECRRQYQAVA